MASIGIITEELQTLNVLRLLANAFIETSAIKIKNIRTAFESNKTFYEEVTRLYHLVQYNAYIAKRLNKKSEENIKTLSVALTANHRFYGGANIETMKKFMETTEGTTTDRLVIGVTGIDYLASIGYPQPFQRMQFAMDLPTYDETFKFLNAVKPYKRVIVFYTKFVSLLTQSTGVTDITQSIQTGEDLPEEEIHIIFEPELPKILDFFENQIRMLLFLRVLLESDLARTATRLITMTAAEQRIEELHKERETELRKARRSRKNRELLETFAGIKKWRKH